MDIFAITVTSDSMRLQSGRGETTFTVTNNSPRALRARAEILPAKPQAATWLSIAQEPERHFPPGAVEQFVVKINVPPGTPEEDHSFFLRVADIADPNERYTKGPTVAFKTAAAPAPPAPPPKPFPWWIFAVIGLGFLMIIGGIVYWAARDPGVPEVVGETEEEAIRILEAAGFTTITTASDSGRDQEGKVVSQIPGGGESRPEDNEVSIAVGVRYFRVQLKHGGEFMDGCNGPVHMSPVSFDASGCQLWREVSAGDGWFRLQLKQSEQFLDVENCAGPVVRTNSLSDSPQGEACQLWRHAAPTADGQWFKLQLKHNNWFLDADHCTAKLGMNPGSTWEDGACQLWKRVERDGRQP